MQKKNICMIIYTNYNSDQRVRREAETLAVLPDYQVKVIGLKTTELPRYYDLEGVKVIEVNEKKYSGKSKLRYLFSYIKFLVFSFIACTKLFFSGQVDIVHVHNMPNYLVLSAIVPRLFNKKLILDIHDTVPETFATKFNIKSKLFFQLLCLEEFFCCMLSHKIICVNHVQRDVLVNRGISIEKILISMNVPDHKRFHTKNIMANRPSSNDQFKMVYHGTMAKRLGADIVINAVACLVDEIPGLNLNLWGNGDDLDEFIALAKKLGVDNRVHFVRDGFPLNRLPSELIHMDLGIVGNRKNIATKLMLPVKMLECIALGIPVIVPKLKGIEYYFSDEMVCYFEPEDVESMANAILMMYRDPPKRLKKAEKAKAFLNKYGWEKHKSELISFYQKL